MEDLQKCPTYHELNSSYTTSTQIACPLLSGTRLPVEVHNALRGAGSSCLDSGRGDGRGMVGGFARQLVKCPQKRPVLMTAHALARPMQQVEIGYGRRQRRSHSQIRATRHRMSRWTTSLSTPELVRLDSALPTWHERFSADCRRYLGTYSTR
jgi:hypothetical protein